MSDSTRRFALSAGLGFALVILLAAVPSGVSVAYAYYAAERRDHLTTELTLDVAHAERLRAEAERVTAAARAYLLSGEPQFLENLRSARDDFDEQARLLRSRTHLPAGAEQIRSTDAAADAYDAEVDRVLALRAGPGGSEREDLARTFERDMVPRHRALLRATGELIAFREAEVDRVGALANHAFARGITVSLFATGAALLASAALAHRFARRLTRAYNAEHEATRAAREAIAVRDEIIGVVAHDLRSPLSAIGMKAALIRDGVPPPVAAHQAARIAGIVQRMELLIRSLLDAASIDAGRFSVAPQAVKAQGLLDEVTEIFADQAVSKRIQLDVVPADPALEVLADRDRVDQVLGNLVSNAIKFTPPGGAVGVRVEPAADGVRFAVSDSGPGIAPEQLCYVFERFWRGGSLRGAGLGLYIARGIVEAHQGRISVDTEPGRGSTFAFTLPRARQPSTAP